MEPEQPTKCHKVDETPVRLRKELGLLEGFTMIMGNVIGSGIFVAPKGVITYVGSVGMSLAVWAVSGVLTMLGGLCFTELGESGSGFTIRNIKSGRDIFQ